MLFCNTFDLFHINNTHHADNVTVFGLHLEAYLNTHRKDNPIGAYVFMRSDGTSTRRKMMIVKQEEN